VDAERVRIGDWVQRGRVYREVTTVERVPSPHSGDRPWVQLTVNRDGQPHALDPMPPDWPVEVDRSEGGDAIEQP
jgi:hypothetical protein